MPELRCKIMIEENIQCPTVLIVAEPVSENASYICRNHPDSVQRAVAGNTKQPRPNVHFQEYQFDPDMERSAKPQGTSHIGNQGGANKTAQRFDREGNLYPRP